MLNIDPILTEDEKYALQVAYPPTFLDDCKAEG